MKNKQIISIFCIFAMLSCLFSINVCAEVKSQGLVDVYDYADILSESMEDDLYDLGEEYAEKLDFDIVFLTTYDNDGQDVEDYADDFYDGLKDTGKKYGKDGILFLIDMASRNIYISTCGEAIYLLNDDEIEDALDAAFYYLPDDYDNGMYALAEKALEIIEYNLENEPSALSKVMLSFPQFLLSIILAIVAGVSLFMKHNKANKSVNASCYAVGRGIEVVNRQQRMINQYDNVIRGYYKPKSSSSGSGRSGGSSHRSSSGRSHGGGGRRF